MSPVLLFLFGLTLVFIGFAAVGVMWAIRSGQFDDLEGPAQRILMDDDDPLIPFQGLNKPTDRTKMDK
jgi:cbb3-type cytochrome oxidase maturation protein